jgi:hypothetical protein
LVGPPQIINANRIGAKFILFINAIHFDRVVRCRGCEREFFVAARSATVRR